MHLTDEDRKYVVTLIHYYCAAERTALTLNLLTTTIVVPPSNASKWQMGFNSAFKGLMPTAYGLPRDNLYFVSYLAWWTKNDLSQLFSSF